MALDAPLTVPASVVAASILGQANEHQPTCSDVSRGRNFALLAS
jgi:hypothetical protein